MNSSAITMSAQGAVIKPNNERMEPKNYHNQRKAQHQNAWAYISSRILGIIHKTFRKGELIFF